MRTNIADPALARRHRQSAIVSEMMLAVIKEFRRIYRRKPNFNSSFEEILVAMVIRQNDARGGEPLTVSGIAQNLSIPRSNAKRATEALIDEGVILKEGTGFVGDLDYLTARIDADYFKSIMAAIIKAADDLNKTGLAIVCTFSILA
jgi:hypothetical protein